MHYQQRARLLAERADPSLVPFSRQPLPQRFWSQVYKDGPTIYDDIGPCWLWIGPSSDQRGRPSYGYLTIDGKRVWAHHIAWYLANGEWPTGDAEWVLHRCDNPPCVRPSHLFLGDHAANMADMAAKGRRALGPRRRIRPIEEDRPLPDSIADIAAEEGVTEAQLRQALRESHPDASVAEVMLRAREMER
jgi:hypothetical protein